MDSAATVKALATAYSEHVKSANRLWSALAILSLLALGAEGEDGKVTIFGVPLAESYFFIVLVVIISAINIAYCSSHFKVYQVANMYSKILHEFREDLKSDKYDFMDYYHSLYNPLFNRIYPIFHGSKGNLTKFYYPIFKIFVDGVFVFLPCIGIFIAFNRAQERGLFSDAFLVFWAAPVLVIVISSLAISLSLYWQSLKWVWSQYHKE